MALELALLRPPPSPRHCCTAWRSPEARAAYERVRVLCEQLAARTGVALWH